MTRRIGAGLAALALAATALTGCARTATIGLCPGPLTGLDVYNYYADHPAADHQAVGADAANGSCTHEWAELSVAERTFETGQLDQRSVTVLVLHLADGGTRTIRVHRLAGWQAGQALLLDTGESWFLADQAIEPYYAAASEPVDRDRIP